jgi:hypothetical protein
MADELWQQEQDKRISELETKLAALEIMLVGDQEQIAKYEAGKANYPSMKEPPRGLLVELKLGVERADKHNANWYQRYQELSEQLRKLWAFFAPILDGKNPPLDGEQMPTKAWVDKSLATLAGALRAEIEQISAEITSLGSGLKATSAAMEPLVVDHVKRVEAERERANRPSRLEALRYVLTGRGRA